MEISSPVRPLPARVNVTNGHVANGVLVGRTRVLGAVESDSPTLLQDVLAPEGRALFRPRPSIGEHGMPDDGRREAATHFHQRLQDRAGLRRLEVVEGLVRGRIRIPSQGGGS
jgi:hypothetical protein